MAYQNTRAQLWGSGLLAWLTGGRVAYERCELQPILAFTILSLESLQPEEGHAVSGDHITPSITQS